MKARCNAWKNGKVEGFSDCRLYLTCDCTENLNFKLNIDILNVMDMFKRVGSPNVKSDHFFIPGIF